MGPKKRNTAFSVSNIHATVLIILINIFVFFYLGKAGTDKELVEALALTPANLFAKGNLSCLVTAGFLHKDIAHLFFNVLGIFIFGGVVERRFGAFKTLLIYFGALVLSMFFSTCIYTFVLHKNIAIIGASGALMGLISCAMLTDPFTITYETLLPIPVMVKGWMFFYADMRGFLKGETDGVSHLAHLLGFLSIAILIYFLEKKDRKMFFKGLVINGLSFGVFLFLSSYLRR